MKTKHYLLLLPNNDETKRMRRNKRDKELFFSSPSNHTLTPQCFNLKLKECQDSGD